MKLAENMERLISRIIQLSDAHFVEFFKNVPEDGIRIYAKDTRQGCEFNTGADYEFIIQPLSKS